MKINCPYCNQVYHIDNGLWGRYVECEACNKKFVAGQSSIRNEQPIQVPFRALPKKKTPLTSPKAIIAIFGGISILLVIGFAWYMAKRNEKPVAESVSVIDGTKFYTYKSNEKLTIDLSKQASYIGALGFRWDDKPKESGYKFPCEIKYPSEGSMFSEVKLGYNEQGGLWKVSCSRSYDISIPNFSQAPRRLQKDLRINFIEHAYLPIFNTVKEVAEVILDKDIECFYGEKQFTGMTTDEDKILGIIRMDVKDTKPFVLMSIMKLEK